MGQILALDSQIRVTVNTRKDVKSTDSGSTSALRRLGVTSPVLPLPGCFFHVATFGNQGQRA